MSGRGWNFSAGSRGDLRGTGQEQAGREREEGAMENLFVEKAHGAGERLGGESVKPRS